MEEGYFPLIREEDLSFSVLTQDQNHRENNWALNFSLTMCKTSSI